MRDSLLGRPVTERDWVVVGATPEQMLAQGYTQVGKDFPVFLHPDTKEEYALARTERKSGKGYTGFVCNATPDVTLEQDLQRRDLTINAMAQTTNGEIVDPYQGLTDLENRVLRHVSPAFSEDPLRVFRVARFAARYAHLGFTLAPETCHLMHTMAANEELTYLTAERVWKETQRSLTEQHPQVYFQTLAENQCLEPWFSELAPVIANIIARLQSAAEYTHDASLLWAVVGTQIDAAAAQSLCKRLKCANHITELCELSSRYFALLSAPILPETCLEIFNVCDAWRKPERFLQILTVIKLASNNADSQHQQNAKLRRALTAARELDAKKFIRQGLKGAEIGHAMNHERLRVIQQHLS